MGQAPSLTPGEITPVTAKGQGKERHLCVFSGLQTEGLLWNPTGLTIHLLGEYSLPNSSRTQKWWELPENLALLPLPPTHNSLDGINNDFPENDKCVCALSLKGHEGIIFTGAKRMTPKTSQ